MVIRTRRVKAPDCGERLILIVFLLLSRFLQKNTYEMRVNRYFSYVFKYHSADQPRKTLVKWRRTVFMFRRIFTCYNGEIDNPSPAFFTYDLRLGNPVP